MNALRTFVTADPDGIITIHVPEEYRQQSLEVIVLRLNDFLPPESSASESPKRKISDKYRGVFTKADAQSFDNHTQQMREEWTDI